MGEASRSSSKKTTELSEILRSTGKNYGWALRFRSGGRALAAFSVGTGSFTVQIIIGQAQLEKASQLRLNAKVRIIGQAQLEKASQLRPSVLRCEAF